MSNTAYFTAWLNSLGEVAPHLWRLGVVLFALVLSAILIRILRAPGRPDTRWSGWELLLIVVGFGGLLVLRIPAMATMGGSFDEDLWLAGAITLKADPRFWISFDGTTSGPLTVYPVMLPYLWGGVPNYGFSRLLTAVFWGMSACFLFASLRHLVDRKIAAITATCLFAFLGGCSVADYVMLNGEHAPVLCMLMSLWLLSRQRERVALPLWQCLIIGVLLGLAPFAKLQAGPMALALGLFAIWKNRTLFSRIGLVCGALFPLLLVVVYAIRQESAAEVWHLAVVSVLKYSGQVSDRSWIARALSFPPALLNCVDSRLFFGIQIQLAVVALIGLIETSDRKRGLRSWLVFSVVWMVLSVLSIIQTGMFFPHYLLFLIPPLLLWNALAVNETVQAIPQLTRYVSASWKWRHAAYCCLLMSIAPVLPAVRFSNSLIPRDAFPLPLVWNSPLSEEVLKLASSGTRLVVWGHQPELYVQTNLASGTRYVYPNQIHAPWSDGRYDIELFVRDLKQHSDVIFVEIPAGSRSIYPVPAIAAFPELEAEISRRFQLVGTTGECRIWQAPAPASGADEPPREIAR